MTTRKPKIIRAPRHGERPDGVDEDSWNVILHVKPKAHSIRLNVEVMATEGENSFVCELKENKLHKYIDPTTSLEPTEWLSVLRTILLSDPEPSDILTWSSRLECTAQVKDTKIDLQILENVDGIKRRLGTIPIPSGDAEIELLNWLFVCCSEKDSTQKNLWEKEVELKMLKDENERLSKQIEDFIRVKQQGEKDMILKFTLLLNEKKRKIRQVVRSGGSLGVKSDDVKEEDISESSDDFVSTKKEKKGKASLKRKASQPEPEESDAEGPGADHQDTSDDDDVSMTGRETPDRDDDDETTDDEDGDIPPSPPPEERNKIAKGGSSRRSVSPPKTRSQDVHKEDEDGDEDMDESGTLEAEEQGDDEL